MRADCKAEDETVTAAEASATTPEEKEAARMQRAKVAKMNAEVTKQEGKLAGLLKKFERRKRLLLQEEDLLNDVILEEGNIPVLDDDDENYQQRVTDWVDNVEVVQSNATAKDNAASQVKTPQVSLSPPSSVTSQATRRSEPTTNGIEQLATAITEAISKVSVKSKPSRHEDLLSFNGKPEDWPVFKNEYDRLKPHLDKSLMIIKLRKALTGQAKETVHHLTSNVNNLEEIMQSLEERFGQAAFVLEALANKARSTPSPSINKPETIVEFGIAVHALVTNINSYKNNAYLYSVELLQALVRKLPGDMCTQWFEWLSLDSSRQENLLCFSEWMKKQRSIAYRRMTPASFEDDKPPKRNRHVGVVEGKEAKKDDKKKKDPYCVNCSADGHHIRECRKFAALSDEERIKLVRDKRLCFGCLRIGHSSKDCKSKKKCSVTGCQRSHHPLLHGADKEKVAAASPAQDANPTPQVLGNVNHIGEDLLWYCPVKIRGPNGERSCIAMLDTAAQPTMLDEDLANELGITGEWDKIHLGWFNGDTTVQDSMHVNLEVAGDYSGAQYYKLAAARTVKDMDLPPQSYCVQDLKKKYPHLRGAPLRSMSNSTPSIVIGTGNWSVLLCRDILEASPHVPAAIKTKLGWVLVGPGGKRATGKRGLYSVFGAVTVGNDELNGLMKQFVISENFGVENPTVTPRSKEDRCALQIMEETTTWTGQRYSTGLLWRDKAEPLPESKQMAVKRLFSIERKADRSPEFAELYTSRFEEYIRQGYLRKLDKLEESNKRWYLPHFFAYHASKKPRLVYDAAAKSNGKSFNDFLLKGPDLLQPLAAVLMRFRRHNVAVTGDITSMFHQVALREEDQPAQTILYRGMERNKPSDAYQMTVLFFGSACSPASAIYVKDSHAQKYVDEFPEAVNAIVRDTYMDDFISGSKTEDTAIKLQQEVEQIHVSGGFPIGKWNSNSVAVLNKIPEELRASGDKVISSKSDLGVEKTLGIFWDQRLDQFKFKLDMDRLPKDVREKKRLPTKREIASFIMSLFDPLGFLTPLKSKGLVILQNCWKLKIDWDSEVSDGIGDKFQQWLDELPQINEIGISRCYAKNIEEHKVQLHVFCDASEEAYSAVAYLRIDTGGSIMTGFVTSKGKVAKLKGMTIPRMELNAALMGARIAACIHSTMGEEIGITSTVFWTDSRTVLCWLQSEHGRFSQYVSNRVNEILELSKAEQWRWVPTLENVADEATRSTKPTVLSSSSRWYRGSDFLFQPESDWPILESPLNVDEAKLEQRPVIMTIIGAWDTKLPLPDVNAFSSWWKLIWKTASWIRSFRKVLQKMGGAAVSMQDVHRAELLWLKQAQLDSFQQELHFLKKNMELPTSSKLRECSPTLDNDGVIVMDGRIKKFIHSQNKPVILDGRHPYVKLLILHYHENCAHQYMETVLSNLRKKYWILHLRPAVKRAIKNCVSCRIIKAKPSPPEMGPIPECRLASGEPAFTHTGVDLFGPFEVAIGRRTEKRWGILFTCMTMRAVYIDLVPSLMSSDVIDAIVRFSARRGPPAHLYSDQGTNFKGADTEIGKCYQELEAAKVQQDIMRRRIQWHFNCPAASNMGGSWERMIGLTRKILTRIMKGKRPKEYTLLTYLAEAEGILNNRPLTFVSRDPEDETAITPNHLLNLQ